MRTSTIVNNRSGSWARHASFLTKLARQSNSPIVDTGGGVPLRNLIQQAIDEGCERLIVAGGDGSVSRVVNALAPKLGDIELAILPTGTGNDLARSIGVFGDSLEAAWRIAVEATATPIDVVRVSNGSVSYFVNAATGGFGGKVSTDVHATDKERWGSVAYWITAFSKLAEVDPYDIRLEMDDQTISLTLFSVAIANGRYVGGGFPIAPSAYLNDGLLNVTTIPVLPPLELLAAGVDFTLGRNQAASPAKTYQTTRARIHSEPDMPISLDGEPTCAIDATFEILPHVLPIACGPGAVALKANRGTV
jgi:diacylglycerol kinase (ATP)